MSLKKAKDYLGNDLQVDSALKDGKGQVIHKTYIKKTIPDGTIAKNIGVDSNGDIVKETPASGGGGTQWYKHTIVYETETPEHEQFTFNILIYNTSSTVYSNISAVITAIETPSIPMVSYIQSVSTFYTSSISLVITGSTSSGGVISYAEGSITLIDLYTSGATSFSDTVTPL